MAAPPFSAQEINRRQEGIRNSLKREHAFVAFSFTGSFYLSGAPIVHWGRIAEGDLRTCNNAPLKIGMAISVEPFTQAQGVGATRLCGMILVTETGNERLSQSPTGRLSIAS